MFNRIDNFKTLDNELWMVLEAALKRLLADEMEKDVSRLENVLTKLDSFSNLKRSLSIKLYRDDVRRGLSLQETE